MMIQNDALDSPLIPSSLNRYYPQPTHGLLKRMNQRLMISNGEPIASELDNQQQQTSDQSSFLDIQTRSMGGSAASGQRGPTFNLPKSFISTLYGRQGTGQPGIGGYNKKAEPKDNFFMHFG